MTLIEALSNETTRLVIDAIEDLWVSMDQGERQDPILEDALDCAVTQCHALGFDYDPRG